MASPGSALTVVPCSATVVRLRLQIHVAARGPHTVRRVVISRAARSFRSVSLARSRLQLSHVGATSAVVTGGRAVAGSSLRDRPAQLQHAVFNPEPPKAGGGAGKVGIVWFRTDLRTDDNEALFTAHARCTSVLPVYVVDPREYGKGPAGFDKVGPYKAKFLLEALADLRGRLREAGSDLLIARGKPEEVLPAIAKTVGASTIYAHADVTEEDCLAERSVRSAAEAAGAPLKLFWGSTLFHLDDLPFSVPSMPTSYGSFREKAQACAVREALKQPSERRGLPAGSPDPGEIPTLAQLGIGELPKGGGPSGGLCGAEALVGGETEALKRLRAFLSDGPPAGCGDCGGDGSRRGARAGASPCGANFSCKVSPWLALGCLSPRRMFWDVKQATERLGGGAGAGSASASADAARVAAKGASAPSGAGGLHWLVFELLWRDFFRLTTLKYSQTKAREALTAPQPGTARKLVAGAAQATRAEQATVPVVPAAQLEKPPRLVAEALAAA